MKGHLFALSLLALAAASSLHAQAVLQANIPFQFAMGPSTLPSGTYQITCGNNGLVTVRELGGKHSAMILTSPTATTPPDFRRDTDGKLVFDRYGDEYFLSGIWAPAARDGLGLPKSLRQKELARRAAPPNTTIVAMQK